MVKCKNCGCEVEIEEEDDMEDESDDKAKQIEALKQIIGE